MEKNEAKISGFAVVKKASSPWKKAFLKKKIIPAYFCRYDLQSRAQNIFFK